MTSAGETLNALALSPDVRQGRIISSTTTPRVVFQQSLANHPDVDIVRRLIANVPGLGVLRQKRMMAGGYSGSRVYLALAELPGTPPAHWILKLGNAADLAAESEAYDIAKASPAGMCAVAKIHFAADGADALIVYDFAGLDGEPPIDLHDGIAEYEAEALFEATLELLSGWTSQPEWKDSHVTRQLIAWSQPKLASMPPEIRALRDNKTIYFPDLGEALSNPNYYISRKMLPRIEGKVPFAFTHGDLNLRNLLFPTDRSRRPLVGAPRLIDLRHAGTEQWSVVDLAKVEACLRHQFIDNPETHDALTQVVAFIDASTAALVLGRPPEILARGDKKLQALWRHIARLRDVVAKSATTEEAKKAYWATLIAYVISFASYDNRPDFHRRLSFMDAARVFTRQFQRPDLKPGQGVLPLQSGLSPDIQSHVEPTSWSAVALAARLVARGDAVLVVGQRFGRMAGAEPLPSLLQNLHKDLGLKPPPITSPRLLLSSLGRSASRGDIVAAIKSRVSAWSTPDECEQLARAPWAFVIQLNFGNHVSTCLRSFGREVVSLDAEAGVSASVSDPTTLYLPFYGDADSRTEHFPLTPAQIDERLDRVATAAETIRRRLRPYCIIFWRCEDVDPELLVDIRLRLGESVESFYISDEESPEREAALASVGVVALRARLPELTDGGGESAEAGSSSPPDSSVWRRAGTVYRLPNVQRQTAGLLSLFSEMGALGAYGDSRSSFLLGAPPTVEDIEEGRVLRRSIVERDILPAIQGSLVGRERVRWIFVEGRPGAGVSTCLCLAAQALSLHEVLPIFVVSRTDGTEGTDWRVAGELLGEVSNQVGRPVAVFVDSLDLDPVNLDKRLVEGALSRHGELILVVGGRSDLIKQSKSDLGLGDANSIVVPDSLSAEEWVALAQIVQAEGYSADVAEQDVADRMRRVGLLLPAIYEATDRQNRKFAQIVAYEYRRHSRDQLVQRTYRLVCVAGALGFSVGQYWLLKAVGGEAVDRAREILTAISDDIVLDRALNSTEPEGDLGIAPRHRLIAEAVLQFAVPDPEHRLADIRSLVAAANLGLRREGLAVARVLARKSAFRQWLVECFGYARADREAIQLFQQLLCSGTMDPFVETTLRQHNALTLRTMRDYESALEEAKRAYNMDPNNPASAHVLGLVHESKALAGWRLAFIAGDEAQFAAAAVDEQEATAFFRQTRDQQPTSEYGYESEARYLRRKAEVFSDRRNQDSIPEELADDHQTSLARGLRLLQEAELRVPPKSLKESRQTKARVLSQMGDFEAAWSVLQRLIDDAEDTVRRNELREIAASLAVSHTRWEAAKTEALLLVDSGVRSPYAYLLLDSALEGVGARDERRRRLRESAEEWNRDDLETLIRWGGVCAEERDWLAAAGVLQRAERVAQRLGVSTPEQFRRRGRITDAARKPVRFRGVVVRLFRPYEGLIQIDEAPQGAVVYFREEETLETSREIGAVVEFSIGYRIRGLRADDPQFSAT